MVGASQLDADCDGIPTPVDCDDLDPQSASRVDDGDCDGVLTPDDYNDGDPASTVKPMMAIVTA